MKATLSETEKRTLAERIMWHLNFHSTRMELPVFYQFALPDGALMLVGDSRKGERRSLVCWSATGNAQALTVAIINRARGSSLTEPWFVDLTPKQHEKVVGKLTTAIEYVHRNRDANWVRRGDAAYVDTMSDPAPLPQPTGERPAFGFFA
ncbi:hypothetical protein [Protaetiibacter larvae]|uniref:Uncharacterized protein n=1 Tax=Protaetiibacter larvae TaxID=2592654 RepID=A0A5C1YC37_9MICO|nr:hypothetical protein [Protaetiibacter larvae]QEO10649.1 hypothetical protein FLP23_11920 [Protaetiibacter larvae]